MRISKMESGGARILLMRLYDNPEFAIKEIECYHQLGFSVVANRIGFSEAVHETVRLHFIHGPRIDWCSFDPTCEAAVFKEVMEQGEGFDAVICPPLLDGRFPLDSIIQANASHLRRKIKVIGTANDSVRHVETRAGTAEAHGIQIVNAPGVHAESVAEYTIWQFGWLARRLGSFYAETGLNGNWPHARAIETRLLNGKVVGVIGGAGRDGVAVIRLAVKLGLSVVAIGSGSEAGDARIRLAGATVAESLNYLLRVSDFISVNCRVGQTTLELIGEAEIAEMKPGVIIVDPAGADIFKREALLGEFEKPVRRIGALVLDMPFGGRRDVEAFRSDSANARLRELGVLFTPRIAGYTKDSWERANEMVAKRVADVMVGLEEKTARNISACSILATELRTCAALVSDSVQIARNAGEEALRLRDQSFQAAYKDDGTAVTNVDPVVERMFAKELKSLGHVFRFQGEELGMDLAEVGDVEVVVDGIDGTRNFRDGNYGWCISLAVKNRGITVGAVVHDPITQSTFFANRGSGAFFGYRGRIVRMKAPDRLPADFSFSIGSFRIKGSTTVKRQIADDIKTHGGREREWGSVALSICAVARGGLGAFVQGNSIEHDHVAAVLIAQEAGVVVSQFPAESKGRISLVVAHPSLSPMVTDSYRKRTATE